MSQLRSVSRLIDDPPMLTWEDLGIVQSFLKDIAPSWSADLNHSSPGESTIVISPAEANDLLGPAFVLNRSEGRVRLDQFRWDEYRHLGAFESLNHALGAMAPRLIAVISPGPVTALPWGRDRSSFHDPK